MNRIQKCLDQDQIRNTGIKYRTVTTQIYKNNVSVFSVLLKQCYRILM